MTQGDVLHVGSENRVLLHLHLPKTAGSTLNQWLYSQTHGEEANSDKKNLYHSGVFWYPGARPPHGFLKELGPEPFPDVLAILQRTDLRAVLGHFSYGLHRYVALPTAYITVLRNPVDRLLSLYYHLKPGVSIEDFVGGYRLEGFQDHTRLITDNDQTRRISGCEPPFGQCDEQTLAVAKKNLRNEFAVVGVTERFTATTSAIRQTFGWRESIVPEAKNVNKSRPLREDIPSETLRLLHRTNEYDVELHRFAEQLLQERCEALGIPNT